MSTENYTLYCFIETINVEAFPVDIDPNKTVGHLKKFIKNEKQNDLKDVDADKLMLWKVDVSEVEEIDLSGLGDGNALKSTWSISDYWEGKPSKKQIHVYIRIRGK